MNQKVRSIPLTVLAVLAALALALAAGCSVSTGQPFDHTLSVTGNGTSRVPPDLAVASIGVRVQDQDAGAAVGENSTKSNAVISAIKTLGIEDKDIQTTNFSIVAQEQFDREGNPTGEVIYITDNTVTVTVRDLSRLGDVLDQAVQAGANSIFGVYYSVEDQSAALAEAREKALADAKARADQLAEGSGVILGRVLSVSESTYGSPVFSSFERQAADLSGVPVSGGNLNVEIQVYVTYEIK